MERATKLLVLGWACVALALEVHLIARGWGAFQTAALFVFVASAALTRVSRKTIALVLVFLYVFPALIRSVHGEYTIYFGVLWMAALLGAIVPDAIRTPWRIPRRWRGALVCWSLILAVSAPIVIGRELDFNLALMDWTGYVWSSIAGGLAPAPAMVWILYVALVPSLGILWFDWLFATERRDFLNYVVTPLLASAGVMASVAVYQMFVNMSFLNETLFGGLNRASGTLFDANLCGMIAALWLAGLVLWTDRLTRWRSAALALIGALLGLAVWGSGSRTAFAAATLIAVCSVAAAGLDLRRAGVSTTRPLLLAAVFVVAMVVVIAGLSRTAVGPLERFRLMSPNLSVQSLRDFGAELWNRNGYGTISTAMIRRFPLFGVGVGSFQIIAPDVATGTMPPDNAQNWYRHQFVELGLIGSIGWLAWVISFGSFVVRPRSGGARRLPVWTARAALVAFALISLFGMPGQDVTVAMTFWTFAYWFVLYAPVADGAILGRRSWWLIGAAVVLMAAGTGAFAATRLRVPRRAQERGWPYSYGFYDPEPDPGGGEFRWAAARAVAVIPAPTRWLHLSVGANHRDLQTRPLEAKVWCDGKLVVQVVLKDSEPVSRYVLIDKVEPWVMLETRASHVVRPADFGIPDERQLGVMVNWSFVPAPPPDASRSSDGTAR